MKCLRIDLHRKFLAYVDAVLPAADVRRIESHVLGCGDCRTRLARLRSGHRLAAGLQPLECFPDAWQALSAAIAQQATHSSPSPRSKRRWRTMQTRHPFAFLVAAASAVALVLFAVIIGLLPLRSASRFVPTAGEIEWAEFHPVAIGEIPANVEPHVVTEGFVSEMVLDPDDGDVRFKLVEDVRRQEPYVVCEIIHPIKVAPPVVGSRVRVYGVSRFDGKTGRQWYEVHPVLSIELVRR